VFRRRATSEKGHRGFRLSSLGVLLAKSSRPRPWRHVSSLKSLVRSMYSRFKDEGIYDPEKFDWSSAETFFEQRKNSRTNPLDSGAWRGWSDELDSVSNVPLFFFPPNIPLTSQPSPIQIFTIPPSIYPTFSASLDYLPSRYINMSLVVSES
jgi:hypothetical protein